MTKELGQSGVSGGYIHGKRSIRLVSLLNSSFRAAYLFLILKLVRVVIKVEQD
jgi:hypothetical protein